MTCGVRPVDVGALAVLVSVEHFRCRPQQRAHSARQQPAVVRVVAAVNRDVMADLKWTREHLSSRRSDEMKWRLDQFGVMGLSHSCSTSRAVPAYSTHTYWE